MPTPTTFRTADCTIIGASFAELACATVLARRGLRVRVMERKGYPGEKLHTTGTDIEEEIISAESDFHRHKAGGASDHPPNTRHTNPQITTYALSHGFLRI